MAIHVSSRLDRSKIDRTKDYEGHLMVTMEADEDPNRTPVCLALVIDVSPSMSDRIETGESKLDAVKQTTKRVIRTLGSNDELSIITFSYDAKVVVPRGKVVNKEHLVSVIDSLGTESSTNISAGLLLGMDQMKKEFRGVRRILLLSDGEANTGVSTTPGIVNICKSNPERIGISTFSYGISCNQELMQAIADSTDGNHTYVQGGDILDSFAMELGGMISCVGQSMTVTVTPNKGNEIVELLNSFDMRREEDGVMVDVSDIYAGEVKNLIFKVRLKIPENPKDREFSVAKVKLSCMDPKSAERKNFEFNPKVAYAAPDKSDIETILAVAEQVAVLKALKAQQESVKARQRNDVKMMMDLLSEPKAELEALMKRGSKLCEEALMVHDFTMIAMQECYDSQVAAMVSNAAYYGARGRGGSTGFSGYRAMSGSSGFSAMSKHKGWSGFSGFSGTAGIYTTKTQKSLMQDFRQDENI